MTNEQITNGDPVIRRHPLGYKDEPTGQVMHVHGRYAWIEWSNHRGGSPRRIGLDKLKRRDMA